VLRVADVNVKYVLYEAAILLIGKNPEFREIHDIQKYP